MSVLFSNPQVCQLKLAAATAHWEDEYEQEDPVTPEGRVFKVNRSSRSDEDFSTLSSMTVVVPLTHPFIT
jgi:hypothetical protein